MQNYYKVNVSGKWVECKKALPKPDEFKIECGMSYCNEIAGTDDDQKMHLSSFKNHPLTDQYMDENYDQQNSTIRRKNITRKGRGIQKAKQHCSQGGYSKIGMPYKNTSGLRFAQNYQHSSIPVANDFFRGTRGSLGYSNNSNKENSVDNIKYFAESLDADIDADFDTPIVAGCQYDESRYNSYNFNEDLTMFQDDQNSKDKQFQGEFSVNHDTSNAENEATNLSQNLNSELNNCQFLRQLVNDPIEIEDNLPLKTNLPDSFEIEIEDEKASHN